MVSQGLRWLKVTLVSYCQGLGALSDLKMMLFALLYSPLILEFPEEPGPYTEWERTLTCGRLMESRLHSQTLSETRHLLGVSCAWLYSRVLRKGPLWRVWGQLSTHG